MCFVGVGRGSELHFSIGFEALKYRSPDLVRQQHAFQVRTEANAVIAIFFEGHFRHIYVFGVITVVFVSLNDLAADFHTQVNQLHG